MDGLILPVAECAVMFRSYLGSFRLTVMTITMTPRFTRLLVILALSALSVGGVRTIERNASQKIVLTPMTLDPANPGPRRIGDLIFLQAWELDSDNRDFGGISALSALPDGRFVGISDAGTLIGFGLTDDNRVDRPFIVPLPDAFGDGKSYKDRDSEGIAYDPDTGQFWVSYEANHAIRRFAPSFARSPGIRKLAGQYSWSDNKGPEALIRLRDGRFIVIAENLENGMHEGLLFSGDPVEPKTAISRFAFRPPDGYRVTDGTALPDGRLLLLNRRIAFPGGFSAKLTIVEANDFHNGAKVSGNVIATLAAPLLVDNMEGVTVTKDAGRTTVWLISDDNFNLWQRTLLMKFRLSERSQKKKPEAPNASGFD